MSKTLERANSPYRSAMHSMSRTFVQVWVFSAIINVLMLTGPIYMLQVYDRVLGSSSIATLQGLFLIAVVLYVFLGLYEFFRARLLSRASYRLDEMLGDGAFAFWLRTGIHRDREGYNPVRDLEAVRNFLAGPAILGLFDLPWMPLFLAVVFFIHPWLGWLTVAGAVVVAIVALINHRITMRPIAEAMALDAEERNFVERSRRNAEAVFALGMQDKVVRRWRMLHGHSLAKAQESGDRSEGLSSFSKAFRLLLQSALLTAGAYLAIRQEISPGSIVATSIIAGRALAPVDQVIGQWRSIGRARESRKRLRAAFAMIPPVGDAVRLPAPKGNLEVSRLTKMAPARADGSERAKILDRLNFSLEPGDALGVIGTSAAGKSSLAKVLVGVWQPDLGEVRLDGATLGQWHPDDLGRHVGYLPQTLEMLPGTIAENIARFDPEASDEMIIAAARTAHVHDMILSLPDGYATRIGGIDQPLSGGQIQRIGLARAIYGMPRLVVLDEPNSNLDSEGDDALSDAIRKLRAHGCVVVVMAHRPSAIAAVNKVMILHRGAVAHIGDKDEVLRVATRPAAQMAG